MAVAWLGVVVAICGRADGEEAIRLACTADTSICIHEGERSHNQGAKTVLRVKGIQHILLMNFDVASIRGKTIEEARLWLKTAGAHKLKTLGVSTVAAEWTEGTSNGEAVQLEVCFLQAQRRWRDWAGPGSDFLDVTYGVGGSRWWAVDLREENDGWISLPVPPEALHALAAGDSCGLAISDEKGQTTANNDIHSREQSNAAPHVMVTKWTDAAAPASGARLWKAPPPVPPQKNRAQDFMREDIPPPKGQSPPDDPIGFRVLHEGETNIHKSSAGFLWDGNAIKLESPRGAHAAFQLAVLLKAEIVAEGWTITKALPCGTFLDPLTPGASGPGMFHLERYVPRDAVPGTSEFSITVGERTVPLRLRVMKATLPDRLSFHVSLNTYGSPGRVLGDAPGSEAFLALDRAFHRLAHAHRATIAVVPYSHHGNVEEGFAPEVKDGAISSWDTWDARWAPYFDGSAFRGCPRDGVPLDHAYLPLHESWPLRIRGQYAYQGTLEDHWRDAPLIENAFPKTYGDAFRAAAEDFAKHFAERGWKSTELQVYLNNKNSYWRADRDACWWLLDEPAYRDDFLALKYFGSLLHSVPSIRFRIDLSRPQWRREHVDGLVGVDVVSGEYRNYPDRVFGRGEVVWTYGGLAAPGLASGFAPMAWVLRAFLDGCDGIVPWQTIGTVKAWDEPEDTAILMPPHGDREPRATLRLKSLRRGQEDSELILLLLAKTGWTRAEIRPVLAAHLDLAGDFRKSSEADAGRIDFGAPGPGRFEEVRREILGLLESE